MGEPNGQHLERLHTGELEIGYTDALQRHITRHVLPQKPVSQRKLNFEHKRPRILRECLAEATGVFFYVLPGIASVASFTLNGASPLGVTAFGSIFQIGWAFSIGIAFAIIICAPTSGGHFNPAVTLSLAIFQGFPWKKVPHYIFSQIMGAFMAALFLMAMYFPEIMALKAENLAKEGTAVFNGGAASIFMALPNPNQTNQGFIFFQEFFVDAFIGLVIWTCLDPANPFTSPVSVPWTIGLAYGAMVWGFAGNTLSTNLARDLGCRIVAAIFFGGEVFTFDNSYSWIAIVVNVPATLFAVAYYEFLLRDSLSGIHGGHSQHEAGEDGLVRHLTNISVIEPGMERGYANAAGKEVLSGPKS